MSRYSTSKDAIRHSNTALGATTRMTTLATWRVVREAGNCVAVQFCIMTEGSCDTSLQHTCTQRHGRTCLRHDRERAMIWPSVHQDTTLCARPGSCAHAMGAQPGFRVCTQPSLDSGHCFGHCSLALFTRFSKK